MRARLVLVLAVALAACDSGGGSSGTPPIPIPPWGNFRHDISNSATSSSINNNDGCVSEALPIDFVADNAMTDATPTLDNDGNILIATKKGVALYDADCLVFPQSANCAMSSPPPSARCPIWTTQIVPVPDDPTKVEGGCCPPCRIPPCPFPRPTTCDADQVVPIGSVSASPTVTSGGSIVFATDGTDGIPGHLFALEQDGDTYDCSWVYPGPGQGEFTSKSSPAVQLNGQDLSLAFAIVGGDDGVLRAFNGDGTVRWSFPRSGSIGRMTSSPGVDQTQTAYITSEDGVLAAVNTVGSLAWPPVSIGMPPAATFLPSPSVLQSIYAVGASGTLFAVNSAGNKKWQFTPPKPITGSTTFVSQTFNVGSQSLIDTIVYAVDTDGVSHGVRDLTGTELQVQRCQTHDGTELTVDCRLDSCLPNTGTCQSNGRCSGNPDVFCASDSCQPDSFCGQLGRCEYDGEVSTVACVICTGGENDPCSIFESCTPTPENPKSGTCVAINGVSVAGKPAAVVASPISSGDPFTVIGTGTYTCPTEHPDCDREPPGHICARGLDGEVPGSNLDFTTANWATGCIDLDNADNSPTRSSPLISTTGIIYVTTDKGVYAIR